MTEPSLSGGPLDSSFEEPRTTTDQEGGPRNQHHCWMEENTQERKRRGAWTTKSRCPPRTHEARRRCGGVDTRGRVTHDDHERAKLLLWVQRIREAGEEEGLVIVGDDSTTNQFLNFLGYFIGGKRNGFFCLRYFPIPITSRTITV